MSPPPQPVGLFLPAIPHGRGRAGADGLFFFAAQQASYDRQLASLGFDIFYHRTLSQL